MEKELVSMSQLAKELGVNKSKINYYMTRGIIAPITKIGKVCVFDRAETLLRLKEINKAMARGRTIEEIKEKMN